MSRARRAGIDRPDARRRNLTACALETCLAQGLFYRSALVSICDAFDPPGRANGRASFNHFREKAVIRVLCLAWKIEETCGQALFDQSKPATAMIS
jgi:hypothetical protein